jgi:hypothetical protein
VTVAPADKHQLAELSTVHDLARFHHRRMEAVIIADLCHPACCARRLAHGGYFGKVSSTRLFDENVLADVQAGYRDNRLFGMGRRDHDGVDIARLDGSAEICRHTRANRFGQFDGAGS